MTAVKARSLHPWRVSYDEAVALQVSLGRQVSLVPPADPVALVAGADVAYSRRTHLMYAAVVVLRYPTLELVETIEHQAPAVFPYIPGLFTFREVPPLLDAFARLTVRPDLLVFDGHGLAHPRRFGLASHAGLLLDCPAIGCAKSRLVGSYEELPDEPGAWTPLVDRGETIGSVLRTRHGVRPVFVSVGHRMNLPTARRLIRATLGRFRLPEPVRLAHLATSRLMTRLDPGQPAPRVRTHPNFIPRATPGSTTAAGERAGTTRTRRARR